MSDQKSIMLAAFTLLPLGIAVRMSLRLLYGARGPSSRDLVHHTINVVGWVLIVAGTIALMTPTFFFAVVLLVMVGHATLEMVLARRRLARETAWASIRGAAERGRTLETAARIGRERLNGQVRRVFERFGDALAAGADPIAAIAKYHGAFPRSAQGAAALAKLSGVSSLGGEDPTRSTSDQSWSRVTQRLGYFTWLLMVMIGVVTFVMIKIVPEFRKIFEEFDLQLPAMTETLVAFSTWFTEAGFGTLLLLGLGGVLLAMFVFWVLYMLGLHPLRPLADRVFFTRHRTQILHLLATAVERSVPLESAMEALSSGTPQYASAPGAQRLRKALGIARRGHDWRSALADARLVARDDVTLLEAAEQAGNLPWAMRAIADRGLARSAFRWEAIQQMLFPLAVFVLAMFVAWFAIGMFIPIVALIENLA